MSEPTPDDASLDHERLADLADEFARRYRRGERPTVEEYARQHPGLAAQIHELFPAMIAMEQSGAASLEVAPSAERVGAVIGRYKLLERLGEGGFGTVFMAEQQEPVRRRVALKLIKPGADSRQVIARFEAERQALAMMDHENIAKVFDAGATDAGRPYFVMELVKGVPITTYCDELRLTPERRLELFVPVCQAVQHAHQKGIIHRDLKPSNVLVALYDGKPVPKVIDFGVAKATGERLVERTMFTGFGEMVGTLQYMSPEQAELNQLDVDTRSDVYSLGVLLYELLTGTTPLEGARLKEAALLEALRVIREEEPPRPSTRLSTSKALPSIAANRGVEPKRLNGLVRGELDWIVMRCLEKDRRRRYQSANGLATDVQHYLNDEPVKACPPSAAYRFRKFARRYAAALAVTALLAAMLMGTIVSQAVNTRRIRREQLRTLAALDDAERGRRRAREALDQLSSRVIGDWLGRQPKLTAEQERFLQLALTRYEEFTREAGDTTQQRLAMAGAYARVGDIRLTLGQHAAARADFARAIELFTAMRRDGRAAPECDTGLASTHNSLAALQVQLGEKEPALRSYEAARALLQPLVQDHASAAAHALELLRTHNNIGVVQTKLGRPLDALKAYEAARVIGEELNRRTPGVAEHVQDLAATHHNMGFTLSEHGRFVEALEAYRASKALRVQLVRDHPGAPRYAQDLARTHNNMAVVHADLGQLEESLRSYDAARAQYAPLVRAHPGVPEYAQDLARTLANLGPVQMQLGRLPEALRSNEAARAVLETLVESHPDVPEYVADLARAHYRCALFQKRVGRAAEALESLAAARALQEPLVRGHPDVPQHAVDLGGMYVNTGNILRDGPDVASALAWYARAIEVLRPVSEGEQALGEARVNLRNGYSARAFTLARLGRHAEALEDWDRAIALIGSSDAWYRLGRSDALARLGEHARGAADADYVAAADGVPPEAMYQTACVYSLCAAAAGADAKLSPPEREQLVETYSTRAVALLRRAVDSGYSNVAHMEHDPDLDAVRRREDFKKLMATPATTKESDRTGHEPSTTPATGRR